MLKRRLEKQTQQQLWSNQQSRQFLSLYSKFVDTYVAEIIYMIIKISKIHISVAKECMHIPDVGVDRLVKLCFEADACIDVEVCIEVEV